MQTSRKYYLILYNKFRYRNKLQNITKTFPPPSLFACSSTMFLQDGVYSYSLNYDIIPQFISILCVFLFVFFFMLFGQKLLKTSCFLLQSIWGALFLLRLARTFCLASAAVGLRRRPLSMKGSEIRLSSSSGTCNTHKQTHFVFSFSCRPLK